MQNPREVSRLQVRRLAGPRALNRRLHVHASTRPSINTHIRKDINTSIHQHAWTSRHLYAFTLRYLDVYLLYAWMYGRL